MVNDVALAEILTKDLHGPKLAQELGDDLALVIAQEWATRLLLDFRRVGFLSSTGFASLFKLVSDARAAGRQVKFCNMAPAVRLGAEVAGLDRVIEIHESEGSALRAFSEA